MLCTILSFHGLLFFSNHPIPFYEFAQFLHYPPKIIRRKNDLFFIYGRSKEGFFTIFKKKKKKLISKHTFGFTRYLLTSQNNLSRQLLFCAFCFSPTLQTSIMSEIDYGILTSKVILLKFIYSEKDTNFCEISTVDLS